MTLIGLLVVLVIVGFAAWLITQIPMPQQIRTIILGVIVFAVILWLLSAFGLLPHGTIPLK